MNDQQLKMIYEPFFIQSQGQCCTGVGLHILHNCVSGDPKGSSMESHLRQGDCRQPRIRFNRKVD